MTPDIIFYVGLSLLFTHELDAIYRHEWRIFPLICRLEDSLAYHVFTIAHIPLLVAVFWLMCHPESMVRHWFQVCMDGFFIVHLGLHLLLKGHEKNEFHSAFSTAIIFSMAVFGLIHLGAILL